MNCGARRGADCIRLPLARSSSVVFSTSEQSNLTNKNDRRHDPLDRAIGVPLLEN
jgi:hypothetical protein